MILTLLLIAVTTNCVLTFATYKVLRGRIEMVQEDVSAIRIRSVPINVGGRLAPSPAELEAAKNRMDKLGIAHPGGPG
jgi:hypothetical protein